MIERNSRKIIKKLKAEGFELIRIKGSHHIFKKESKFVIVQHPKADIANGTAKNIAKMAGWI